MPVRFISSNIDAEALSSVLGQLNKQKLHTALWHWHRVHNQALRVSNQLYHTLYMDTCNLFLITHFAQPVLGLRVVICAHTIVSFTSELQPR